MGCIWAPDHSFYEPYIGCWWPADVGVSVSAHAIQPRLLSEILNPHLQFLHLPRPFKAEDAPFGLTRMRIPLSTTGRINLPGATRASHPACKQRLGEDKSRVSSLNARS